MKQTLLFFVGVLALIGIVKAYEVDASNSAPAQSYRAAAIAADMKADQDLRSDPKFMATPAGKCWSKHFDDGWSSEDCKLISVHKVKIGMNEEQVTASVGRPDHVNRSVYAGFEKDQWVYGSSYLYFEDHILTSFQSTR